ncbi:hypothetical protein F4777DRAFT_593119 [Nemania sp. FL0916]|nr:hypothetical protein F4777DRAFT_593119 [Nemania sp. FL0916]
MKAPVPGDILLFNGQGLKEHLSDRSQVVELERHLGDANSLFEKFLQQCLDAFHIEYSNLNEKDRTTLGCDSHVFYENTEALFIPPEATRSHPVAETISLYMRQILELVVYSAQGKVQPRVIEVTGICTGLIPAALAASFLSYDSSEFLDAALHGFRLSFLVGLRSASACFDFLGDLTPHSAWVLSTFGWPTEQLATALAEFVSKQHQESNRAIQISAIFENDVHSLSGPGQALGDFRSQMIPATIQCRAAHVHGFYHGGSRMTGAVAQILNDIERRKIEFPTWDTLHAPLRSSTTGDRMIKGSSCQSLLETVLSSILVEICDWKKTRGNLFDEAFRYLAHDVQARHRVLCVGPGTRALLQGAPTHDRLTLAGTLPDHVDEDTEDMIAIVGMSINYPGAGSMEELWNVLEKAQCTASKIPSERFEVSDKLSDKFGNFIQDPFQFDPAFFNISPREAKSMDPQQRLLLQAAFEALEDSGYSPDSTPSFQKDSFGVYVGVATNDYVDNLRQDIDVYYSPGTLKAFLSGRISYAFDFLGPSIVVDTACSSSLVALYQACQALRSGECTAALAGGVNTISSPDMYNGLARAHFLSSTGQCKPFDAAADGYCRAEGCGLVVVKKLSSAIEENDRIYGVIRGIGVNQCGIAKSITHPDHRTQAALFSRLLKSSRAAPDTISVVEAHGTGTQAGDLAEVLSLSSTFGDRSASNPLYVSSIKGNIGHAEAASGIAGVAKLLAMMQRGQIPPQASFKSLNPRLADHLHGLSIPEKLTEWVKPSNQSARRAMICNFGAAGSNSALVLEEYVSKTKPGLGTKKLLSNRSCHVLNLSARSEKALELLKNKFIAHMEAHPDMDIADLCFTANSRRQAHDAYRLSATGEGYSQLVSSLRQAIAHPAESKKHGTRKTIFVFSGQGHARIGMGAEMLSTVPEFRTIVDQCDAILSENGFPTVTPFLSDSPNLDIRDCARNEIVAQCALFTLEYALAQVWAQWGISPDAVIGHSIGEYAAMAIAGMMDVKDALLLVAKRAKLIVTKCVPGMSGMVTCRASIDDVRSVLGSGDSRFYGLDIACINGFEDIVVSGPIESLKHFIEHCKLNRIKAKQLDVSYGFHSSCMDPILSGLRDSVSGVEFRQPQTVVGSSLRGKLLGFDERLRPDYFLQHSRNPVNFRHVVEDIQQTFPHTTLDFIEIGPSPSSESMIRRIIKKGAYTFLPSLRPTEKPWKTLSQSLSSLFLRNQLIKWRDVYSGSSSKFLTSLPKYPLNTSRYYVRFQEQSYKPAVIEKAIAKPSFELLGSAEPTTLNGLVSFRSHLEPLAPYIKAHTVAGIPLCPASVLMELALEALGISQGTSSDTLYTFADIVFEKPLVYADQMSNAVSIQTDLDMKVKKEAKFSLSTNNQLHCSGLIIPKSPSDVVDLFLRKSSFVNRQRRTLHQESGSGFDIFSSRTIYDVIFPRVVAYGDPFLTLKQLSVSESRLEGYGTLRIDGSFSRDKFVCDPAFVDTLLHAPGFIANIYVPADIACICIGVECAYLPNIQQLKKGEMTVYCNLTDVGHSIISDTYIIDAEDKVVGFIEGARFKKIPLKSFNNHLSHSLRPAAHKPILKVLTSEPPRKAPSESADTTMVPSPRSDTPSVSPMESLFLETCGIQMEPSMVDSTLATLGVDSLLSIELGNELSERFGFVVDDTQHNISELTFGRLQKMLAIHLGTYKNDPKTAQTPASAMIPSPETATPLTSRDFEFQRIVQHQSHGPQRCNGYLFHDGSGHCSYYSRMSSMNRTINGIFSPEPSAEIQRLEDLASLYIKRTKLFREHEVILGGWSFGGVLAFEVARQLQSLGRQVKGLILIDSPPPVNHEALPSEIISHVLRDKTANDPAYVTESSKEAREKLQQRFQYHASLLQNYHPEPQVSDIPCIMLKCSYSMDTAMLCNVTYPWISDDNFRERSVSQWEQLMGRSIPVLDVACNHFQVFDPDYVGDVSQKMMLAYEMLDIVPTEDNSA